MTQNLPMIPKARSVCASMRSRCFLPYGYMGFRFVRYQCSPWFMMAIVALKLLFASKVERTAVQIRYFSAIARIDFVSVYGLLNDLLW
ncbi:MAG: hypothetical protein RBJ76_19285 [Stenomitos frigidus ULC029]